ncbi:MAG: hypothetical protein RBT63_05300 [Bdellovibrionales bacterium]|jgi:hypothetical protein|nr:hypothetical protein [Bdellovibrionales bacterium]
MRFMLAAIFSALTVLMAAAVSEAGSLVRIGVMNSFAVENGGSFTLITVSVPMVHRSDTVGVTSAELENAVKAGKLTLGIADLNPNEQSFYLAKPERFVISDGTLWKPFVIVDHRNGTPLDQKLRGFIAQIYGGRSTEMILKSLTVDQIVGRLSLVLPTLIRFQETSSGSGRLDLFENSALQTGPMASGVYEAERERVFQVALDDYRSWRQIRNAIFQTSAVFPAVPLERYLEIGEGRCIHIALTASLILEKLRVPHRFVLGANVTDESDGSGVGHSWIELPDGRIFDAAWSTLGSRGEAHSVHPTWFRFGNELGQSFRYAYERFNMVSF